VGRRDEALDVWAAYSVLSRVPLRLHVDPVQPKLVLFDYTVKAFVAGPSQVFSRAGCTRIPMAVSTLRTSISKNARDHARPPQRRRFGEIEVKSDGDLTVVPGLTADQAALRAVLSLLWDLGCEVRLVEAITPPGNKDEGVMS
jgi:hypothetical protein